MSPVLSNVDCFVGMKSLKDQSINLIVCDPPYGITNHDWDIPLPAHLLWSEFRRILNPNGVVLMFGVEPFISWMRVTAIDWYQYDYLWMKSRATNYAQPGMPNIRHEIITVFGPTRGVYNSLQEEDGYFPVNQLEYKSVDINRKLHPCQKPIALLKKLIETHSNEGDVVFDPTCGSGSTLIAARDTNRHSIGFEKDETFYKTAEFRLSGVEQTPKWRKRRKTKSKE